MGEYGRVIRCHRDPYGKFHGASIECGLNRATKKWFYFFTFLQPTAYSKLRRLTRG